MCRGHVSAIMMVLFSRMALCEAYVQLLVRFHSWSAMATTVDIAVDLHRNHRSLNPAFLPLSPLVLHPTLRRSPLFLLQVHPEVHRLFNPAFLLLSPLMLHPTLRRSPLSLLQVHLEVHRLFSPPPLTPRPLLAPRFLPLNRLLFHLLQPELLLRNSRVHLTNPRMLHRDPPSHPMSLPVFHRGFQVMTHSHLDLPFHPVSLVPNQVGKCEPSAQPGAQFSSQLRFTNIGFWPWKITPKTGSDGRLVSTRASSSLSSATPVHYLSMSASSIG